MRLLHRQTLPGSPGAVALSPGGGQAAVVIDDSTVLLFRVAGGTLTQQAAAPLTGDRYLKAGTTTITFDDTRLGYLTDDVLLLARGVQRAADDDSVPLEDRVTTNLAALDLRSGRVVRDFEDRMFTAMYARPLTTAAGQIMVSPSTTVIAVDAGSFREVGRARTYDETETPVGEDDWEGDEQLSPDGVAHDERRGVLHVLWRVHRKTLLRSYRDAGAGRPFERLGETRCVEGFEGNGLCISPDGTELAAWGTTYDQFIDLRGDANKALPKTAHLGRLTVYGESRARAIDVHSDIARDFLRDPEPDPVRPTVTIGYRVAPDFHNPRPFYLDDRRVALGTPGGGLLGVNTETGKTEVLYDFGSPIKDLGYHARERLVLACCENGSLSLVSADA